MIGRFRDQLWIVVLLTGGILTGLYVMTAEPLAMAIYYAAEFVALAAVVAGMRIHRPVFRHPWYLLIAALATLTAADLIWDNYEALFGREAATPSFADPLYIAGFCAIGLAFVLWSRHINRDSNRADTLDAGIIAMGLAVIVWMFILEPRFRDSELSLTGQLVSVTYPVLDLFLLILLLYIVMRGDLGSRRSVALFACGTLIFGSADVLWGWGELTEAQPTFNVIAESGWMLGFVFWGAAAIDPTVLELERDVQYQTRKKAYLSTRRAILLVGATLMVPVAVILQQAHALTLNLLLIVIGATALFSLVVSRLQLIVRSLEAAVQKQAELQEHLEYAAYHDPLTGLANRSLLSASLQQIITRREGKCAALLFLDLDNFKEINDRLGHATGDRVLVEVAGLLRQCIRPRDMISRIGGDEFVLLLLFTGEPPLEASISIAQRILKAFEQPIMIDGHLVQVGASIGITWLEHERVSVDNVLRSADRAMYDAKRAGKNRYSISPVTPDALSTSSDSDETYVGASTSDSRSSQSANVVVRV